ncbi:hypothetical protein V9K67_10295 [Paraflavisolibacter sp. H34]|uniref:hypothetical protein n=1 Tax=Huijunlia imazamoxiresistens TaxID=3127457 RepID=UPI00301883FD
MSIPEFFFFLYCLFFHPARKVTVHPMIREASGIAESKAYPGNLWVQEDSGQPPLLYLLKHDGQVLRSVLLQGAENRDWEDLVLAGGFLYIGDIGDNMKQFSEYSFYRLQEPSATADTVKQYQTIRFRYPDGAHNAEAFLVDPRTRDIFILTKTDNPSRIYKLAYPYSFSVLNTATLVGELPYKGVVSAALSPDGRDILVKTYLELLHYHRPPGASIGDALREDYTSVPYLPEMQGEAVTFSLSGRGFYTLSEKAYSRKVKLRRQELPAR